MAPRLLSDIPSLDDGKCTFHNPVSLDGSTLRANGHIILSDVPENISLTQSLGEKTNSSFGSILGFNSTDSLDRHVIPIGKLKNIRFMSIFRFKVWWTTHWTGSNGRDLETETQFVLLENSSEGRPYVLLLPLIEGSFRASLQSGEDDNIDICVESGSSKVTAASFRSVLYMHVGDDPFVTISDAMKVIRSHLATFKLLEEKTPPGIVDKFGWCTWDAFYLTVNPSGVMAGVKGLVDGGCPLGFVIIDDGWQSISHDEDPITKEGMNHTVAGEQMPCRLLSFGENYKFRDYSSPGEVEMSDNGPYNRGMKAFIGDLKKQFKTIDYVYVWHALSGYWGGVRPGVPGLPESKVISPVLSPGLRQTMEDLAVDKIVNTGIGLVPPEKAHQLFNGIHSNLANVGVDGVKVDVIHLLEMLCEDYGGRVELAKAYYKALNESIRKHLKGKNVIASMEHCNDFMFLGTEAIALGRVGDDFWCTDGEGDPYWLQGCHVVHCAYNSLWMGNFIQPDWDMFQSTHPCAEFHAASRAISGGPIYVSDGVGKHNFAVLKRVVLRDGSILRAEGYGLPTRDCLFSDPLHDGKTVVKIWNLNKYGGVVGAFNCQGGGWSREERRNKRAPEYGRRARCTVRTGDVEWKREEAEEYGVYTWREGRFRVVGRGEGVEVSLDPLEYELVSVTPVRRVGEVKVAVVGLVNMYNAGGAVKEMECGDTLKIRVKGEGEMRLYCSNPPKACLLDGAPVTFHYHQSLLSLHLPWNYLTSGFTFLEYIF